jgi:hypothetical protein
MITHSLVKRFWRNSGMAGQDTKIPAHPLYESVKNGIG